jgi:hypothetical protein
MRNGITPVGSSRTGPTGRFNHEPPGEFCYDLAINDLALSLGCLCSLRSSFSSFFAAESIQFMESLHARAVMGTGTVTPHQIVSDVFLLGTSNILLSDAFLIEFIFRVCSTAFGSTSV